MGKRVKLKQQEVSKIIINTYKLTSAQQEILKLCSLGLSNIAISKKLNIELSTVKFHFIALYNKFNIPTNDNNFSPRLVLATKWLKLTGELTKTYKNALEM